MTTKTFCDVCGKETRGDMEHFEEPIKLYVSIGTYNEEAHEVIDADVEELKDICLDCQETIALTVRDMRDDKEIEKTNDDNVHTPYCARTGQRLDSE